MRNAIGAAERIEYRHETPFAQPTPFNPPAPMPPVSHADAHCRHQRPASGRSADERVGFTDAQLSREHDQPARERENAPDRRMLLTPQRLEFEQLRLS
jgi:hypothetical protein